MTSQDHDIGRIVEVLERHRQRATYGAVAGLLGLSPRSLMHGQDKKPRNSWVVSSATKRPSGYTEEQVHPQLQAHPNVLSTSAALAAWLKNHA